MTPEEFCYWLDVYLGGHTGRTMNERQLITIRRTLATLFEYYDEKTNTWSRRPFNHLDVGP